MKTDILIIGGGLAGLALAHQLNEAGRDWQLIEARGRWGGRIKRHIHQGASYDLGPSWFWPGQPRIDAWLKRFELSRFEQAYRGALVYQDEQGGIHRGRGFASMQGSWRVSGGLSALIDALVSGLPSERLHLSCSARHIERAGNIIRVKTPRQDQIEANQVIWAAPPRLIKSVSFSPALSADTVTAAHSIPTWMAGHAKAIAIYKTPFWIEAGLSGDAQSRRGPLTQIHDASPAEGSGAALFGFVGTSPAQRHNQPDALKEAIQAQLGFLFGDEASRPEALILQDWAFEPETAIDLDHQPLFHHPHYGRPKALTEIWDNRLHFGSTEMASQFGGYVEGALEIAEDIFAQLQQPVSHETSQSIAYAR